MSRRFESSSKAFLKLPNSLTEGFRKSVQKVTPLGRKSRVPKNPWEANKWQADTSRLIVCENGQDNHPQKIEWGDYQIAVSQNRSESKRTGQDAIGVARHKEYEVLVLSDGHDKEGHMVAQGVCNILPQIILRRIFERSPDMLFEPVEDQLLYDAFQECENCVCWGPIKQTSGEYVKIKGGQFNNEIGYIAEIAEDEDNITVVVDNERVGYLRMNLPSKRLGASRFRGGATALCFIRNLKRNHCRIATLGDSRAMVLGDILRITDEGKKTSDITDSVLMTTYLEDELEVEHVGYFTPQHNVYNPDERDRLDNLKDEEKLKFEIDLQTGYLINPETKFQIQPTRGFGDMEMFGTGYTHKPELSCTFKITRQTLILCASDGIFDGSVWEDDEEFLQFVYDAREQGMICMFLSF